MKHKNLQNQAIYILHIHRSGQTGEGCGTVSEIGRFQVGYEIYGKIQDNISEDILMNLERPEKRYKPTERDPEDLQFFFKSVYNNPKTHTNNLNTFYENCLQLQTPQNFLLNQKSYKAFHFPDQTFKQQKIMAVRGRWLKWQADLIDVRKLMLQNDGVKYILTIIDVFSKYAICVPLKNKKALSIADQFFDGFAPFCSSTVATSV